MISSKKIDDILNKYLAPFDCRCELGLDFSYWTDISTIYYSLAVPDEGANAFIAFAEELFPNIKADIFIWSFFHELGHHETADDFEDEDWDEYRALVGSKMITNQEYFRLPIEIAATRWAGEYIQTHVDEVARLWQDVAAAIQELYANAKVER